MKKQKLLLLLIPFIAASCADNKNDNTLEFSNDFETSIGWSGNDNNVYTLSNELAHSGKYSSKTDSLNRYGFLFRTSLADISERKLKTVKVSLWANMTKLNTQALLVIALDSAGKNILWQGAKLTDTVRETEKWTEVITQADIGRLKPHKDYVVSIFIWNNGNSIVYTDDHHVIFFEK